MGTIDIILNFPIMDMNRNVFLRNPERVLRHNLERMNRFYGGEDWRDVVYDRTRDLFGHPEKTDIQFIVDAFRDRLRDKAGFEYVPSPIPLRNSVGAIVYYLFFASQKSVAAEIATYIFNKYRTRKRG